MEKIHDLQISLLSASSLQTVLNVIRELIQGSKCYHIIHSKQYLMLSEA